MTTQFLDLGSILCAYLEKTGFNLGLVINSESDSKSHIFMWGQIDY